MKKELMETKILYFDQFDKLDSSTYLFLYNLLPEDRKQRAEKCFSEIDKKISILEYFLVKKSLNIKGLPSFKYSKKGKPFIKKEKYFNISHSEKALVVAISNTQIGVDLQSIIKFDKKLASYIANKKEYDQILSSNNRDEAITRLWVMKESLIKLKSKSIATNLKTLLRHIDKYHFDVFKIGNYYISVCSKKDI